MDVKWKIPVIIAVIILLLATLIIILVLLHNNRNKGWDELVETKNISFRTLKRDMSLEEAISNRRSLRTYSEREDRERIYPSYCGAAQGITDEAEGLRTAPSAGALYPLEIYVAIAAVEGLEAGLYKYDPSGHSLLLKKNGDIREDIYNAALRQDSIKDAAAVIIYCAVFERTAARYKDRAAQYVYIETGHSAQNVYLQAEALNREQWRGL